MKHLLVLIFLFGLFLNSAKADNQLQTLLADKIPYAEGICAVKGNMMVEGGVEKQCVMFVSPTVPDVAWFVIIEHGEPTMVFEININTGNPKLVWWKNKRDT